MKPSPSLEIFTGITTSDRQKWEERVHQALKETAQILYFTPNQIKKRTITELLWDHQQVFQGERVWTLQEFMDKKSQAFHSLLAPTQKAIGNVSAQLLFDEALGQLAPGEKATHPGLSKKFLQLILEIKKSVREDLSHPLSQFLKKMENSGWERAFRQKVLIEYEKLLSQYQLMDPGDVLLSMARAIQKDPSILQDLVQSSKILIVDSFYFLQPLEEFFIQSMIGAVEKTLVYIPLSQQALSQETFALPRRTLEFFHSLPFSQKSMAESKENLQSFGNLFGGEDLVKTKISTPKVIYRETPSPFEEVISMALSIKELLGKGKKPAEILVAFPNYHSYIAMIEEIFPIFEIPYVKTLGDRLDETPLVQALLALLDLPLVDFSPTKILEVLHSPYIYWRSKGMGEKTTLSPSLLEKMIQLGRISDKGKVQWKKRLALGKKKLPALELKLPLYRDQEMALLELISALPSWDRKISLDELEQQLERLFIRLDIPGAIWQEELLGEYPEILQRDYDSWRQFQSTLREVFWIFREIGKDPVPGEIFLKTFREKLGDLSLSGDYLDPQQIAVLGLLDTRGLSFSYVFLGGFTEGDFPRYPEYDVLLSLEERQTLDWASPALRSLAEEKLIFLLLLQSTKKTITLSCPTQKDSNPALASPFLENIWEVVEATPKEDIPFVPPTLEEAFSVHTPYYQDIWLGQIISEGKKSKKWLVSHLQKFYKKRPNLFQILQGIRVSAYRDDLGELSIYEGWLAQKKIQKQITSAFPLFSPSQLETYAKCPYRFFHERVLGFREFDEVDEDITPSERGNLIHEILFEFYRAWREKYPHQSLSEETQKDGERLMLEISKKVFAHPMYSLLTDSPWKAYQQQLLWGLDGSPGRGMLKEFLKKEVESDKIPQFFEWSFGQFSQYQRVGTDENSNPQNYILDSKNIEALLPLPPVKIALRGKIDRIDYGPAEEGEILFEVCDYKTGNYATKADLRSGTAYQLAIYLLAARDLLPSKALVPAGGVYYKLKNPSDVKKTYLLKQKEIPKFLPLVQRNIVEDKKTFRAGYFPTTADSKAPDTKRGYCLYCQAYRVCSPQPSFLLNIRHPLHRAILHRKEMILEEEEG